MSKYPKEWLTYKLKELAQDINEKNNRNEVSVVLTNSASNGIIIQNDFFKKEIANENNTDKYILVKKNDFVYNPRVSQQAPYGPINMNQLNGMGIVSPLYTVFRLFTTICDVYYMKYFFKSNLWHNYIYSVSNEGARHDRMSISKSDFYNMPITIPGLGEQKKIAEILSTWDQAIEKVDTLINYSINQYDSSVNSILAKKKIDNNDGCWHEVTLGKLITEISDRTILNDQYPVLTSSRKGIFLQEDYFRKSVASTNNIGYKIVRKGEFTFRTMSDDGSFKFNRLEDYEVGIVSPAYSVFKANGIEPRFLNVYMNSHTFTKGFAQVVQGGTRLSLKFRNLNNFKITVPEDELQSMIADYFENLNNYIKKLKLYRDQLSSQKKGLMQQLLTGKIRVNVN